MNIQINGIKARVKVCPQYPAPPSMEPPTGYLLTVNVRCEKGQVPDFFGKLTAAFKQVNRNLVVGEAPKNGYIEFRTLGFETELKAIDLMYAAGFKVEQEPPR